jgi:hypothetical protein
MALSLKDESVIDQWSTIVDSAAGHGTEVLDDIKRRLEASEIPGECTWELEEVQSGGFLTRTKREFLVVRLKEFKDYRIYVAARDYGTHLDVCRFVAVQPGVLKRVMTETMGHDPMAMSGPTNILVAQDLRAWVTVVHHAVLDAVEALLDRRGQKHHLKRESQGALAVW